PEAPSWHRAVAAAEAFRSDPPDGQADCFGCGLERTPATGLRPGPASNPCGAGSDEGGGTADRPSRPLHRRACPQG
ncbi:hypothetical protein ACWGIF_08450, partial [Streptomyces sp. NPDC054849]